MAEEIGAAGDLEATVWIGKFVSAEEGLLSLRQGILRFENEKHCLFDAELKALDKIVWHWYSLGGAFEVWIGGASHFISFVPRGAKLSSWYSGLAEGHKWRAAIEGRGAPKRGPLAPKLFVSLYSLIQAFFYACGGVLAMIQVLDETSPMWIRIVLGIMVLCFLYLIPYLLWQAVTTPFRRDS